ncbi:MAG: hypothetical protein ACOCY8_07325 [Spirochaetota bacterium]
MPFLLVAVHGEDEMDMAGETFRATYPEFNTDRWTPFDEPNSWHYVSDGNGNGWVPTATSRSAVGIGIQTTMKRQPSCSETGRAAS